MPFPLPLDPTFRKEVVLSWIEDSYDRLALGDWSSARESWKIANSLYVSLPPGKGDSFIERMLVESRVNLAKCNSRKPNEDCV